MDFLETELEKKYRERFTRMKASSETFHKQQREAMEMIGKLTKTMYTILENMAEREIERDPINFIMEESFLKPEKLPSSPEENEEMGFAN
jgi:hypothetical protein